VGFPPSTTTTITAAPDDGSFLSLLSHISGLSWSCTLSYYLSFSSMAAWRFWRVSRRMHPHSVQQYWLLGCTAFMFGSAACSTLDGSGFGIDMASWDYYTLMFPLPSCLVRASCAAFAEVYITISRRLRHGCLMYVKSPSGRFLVGMLTIN
jgi:hypothetical protein